MYSPSPSIDPIISRLRPRSVGEILDQGFRLYRKHFLTFLAMAAVIFVPINLAVQTANAFLQGSTQQLEYSTSYSSSYSASNELLVSTLVGLALVLALAVAGYFLQGLSHGAITASVADSYLDRPVSFGRGYRSMFKRFGALAGTIMLQFLIGVAIFSPLVLLFMLMISSALSAGGSGDAAAAMVCLMFLLIIPLFVLFAYIFIRLTVVVPVVMIEEVGPREALRRSWSLVQNYWWRTLGLVALLYVLTSVISAGPAYLMMGVLLVLARSMDPILLSVLVGAMSTLISLFIVPLELIASTLYYFDLRVRKEGFDLEAAITQRYWPQYATPFGRSPVAAMATAATMPITPGPMAPPVLGQVRTEEPPAGPEPEKGEPGAQPDEDGSET